jgi:hypothetical protein
MNKLIFFLLVLLSLNNARSEEFTLYIFKSSVGVDWSNPKNLAISIVKNEVYKYFNGNDRLLGHVAIELNCGEKRVMTGMRAARFENRRMVLKEGSGYGVLFHVFPGALEKEKKLTEEIKRKQDSGEVHSIRYTINSAQCEKMWQHYENHIKNHGEFNYGFPLNTLAGEGAGCSAFGVSFLQIANLENPEHIKAWSGNAWVPEELIGPYNTKRYTSKKQPNHAPNEGGKPLSVLDIILSDKARSWAPENQGRYLEFFDPDTMFRWIETLALNDKGPYPIERIKNSLEVKIDLSTP